MEGRWKTTHLVAQCNLSWIIKERQTTLEPLSKAGVTAASSRICNAQAQFLAGAHSTMESPFPKAGALGFCRLADRLYKEFREDNNGLAKIMATMIPDINSQVSIAKLLQSQLAATFFKILLEEMRESLGTLQLGLDGLSGLEKTSWVEEWAKSLSPTQSD